MSQHSRAPSGVRPSRTKGKSKTTLQRILIVLVNAESYPLTVKDICERMRKWTKPVIVKPETMNKYLNRLRKYGLVIIKGKNRRGVTFIAAAPERTIPYIEHGQIPEPAHLTPPYGPPSTIHEDFSLPRDSRIHRYGLLISLSTAEIKSATKVGVLKQRKESGQVIDINNKDFHSITYLPSGKTAFYLKLNWPARIKQIFGQALLDRVQEAVKHEKAECGLAIAYEKKGDKLYFGGSLLRLGSSQYPFELDVHGPESDVMSEVMAAHWDEVKFRNQVLTFQTQALGLLSEQQKMLKIVVDRQENLPGKSDIRDLIESQKKMTATLEAALAPLTRPEPPPVPTLETAKGKDRPDYDPNYA